MSVEVKVCGITNGKDARIALTLGAKYLGFILYSKSPRKISLQDIKGIKNELDDLEFKASENLNKANQALVIKWQELEDREQTSRLSLIVVIIIYFTLIIILALITYRSFALPISRLEGAAARSIEKNKPFNSPEIGPTEVKSLTSKL